MKLMPILLSLVLPTFGQFFQLYEDGTYDFNYHTSNDLHRSEVRYADGTVLGKYAYRAPTGQKIEVEYSAGTEGYREKRTMSAVNPSHGGYSPLYRPKRCHPNCTDSNHRPQKSTMQKQFTLSPATIRLIRKPKLAENQQTLDATSDDELTYDHFLMLVNRKKINSSQRTEPAVQATTTPSVSHNSTSQQESQNETTTATEPTTTTAKRESRNSTLFSPGIIIPAGYEIIPINGSAYGALQLPVALVALKEIASSTESTTLAEKLTTPAEKLTTQAEKLTTEEITTQASNLTEATNSSQVKTEARRPIVYDFIINDIPQSAEEYYLIPRFPDVSTTSPDHTEKPMTPMNMSNLPIFYPTNMWAYGHPDTKDKDKPEPPKETPDYTIPKLEDYIDQLPVGVIPIPIPLPPKELVPGPEILNQDDEDHDLDVDYRPFVPPAPREHPATTMQTHTTKETETNQLPILRVPIAHHFKGWQVPYPVVSQKKVLSWG